MSDNSIKTISNSVKQLSTDPELLKFLDFLNSTVCSKDGCYKELSDKFNEESEKTEELKEEYLQLRTIENCLNNVLKNAPAESELSLFHNSILPYLELLQDADPKSDFEPIIAETETDINEIISENKKIPITKVVDTVQRKVNPMLQEVLAKKREKIEHEVCSSLPSELLLEGKKCSEILENSVNSNLTINVEIKDDRDQLQQMDEQIYESFTELEEESKHNIDLAQNIGKQHVLGSFKEFLEARVRSLELHVKSLRAKRKYIIKEL